MRIFYTTFKDKYEEHITYLNKIKTDFTNYEVRIIKNILQEGIDKGMFTIK